MFFAAIGALAIGFGLGFFVAISLASSGIQEKFDDAYKRGLTDGMNTSEPVISKQKAELQKLRAKVHEVVKYAAR